MTHAARRVFGIINATSSSGFHKIPITTASDIDFVAVQIPFGKAKWQYYDWRALQLARMVADLDNHLVLKYKIGNCPARRTLMLYQLLPLTGTALGEYTDQVRSAATATLHHRTSDNH